MLGIIVLVVVIALMILVLSLVRSSYKIPKVSVIDLCVNSNLNLECELLKHKIAKYFPRGVYVIVIQDDIKFSDQNLYWPKHFAFIHLSDIENVAQKYSYYLLENEHSSKLHDEIDYLINYKMFIS